MADARLRELERRARAGDDPDERNRAIREKIRAGLLSIPDIQAWAELSAPDSLAHRFLHSECGILVRGAHFRTADRLVQQVEPRLGNLGLLFLAVAAAQMAAGAHFPELIADMCRFLKADQGSRRHLRSQVVRHLPQLPRTSPGADNKHLHAARSAILAINTDGNRSKRRQHVTAAITAVVRTNPDAFTQITSAAGVLWLTL